MNTIKEKIIDADGNFLQVDVPAKWTVCGRCEGEGKHVNPSIDGNGLTAEDMADPDFNRNYLEGVYDVVCQECDGRTTVLSVDEECCSPEILEGMERQNEAEAADYFEMMAERRMMA